jgi:hypothetical protein
MVSGPGRIRYCLYGLFYHPVYCARCCWRCPVLLSIGLTHQADSQTCPVMPLSMGSWGTQNRASSPCCPFDGCCMMLGIKRSQRCLLSFRKKGDVGDIYCFLDPYLLRLPTISLFLLLYSWHSKTFYASYSCLCRLSRPNNHSLKLPIPAISSILTISRRLDAFLAICQSNVSQQPIKVIYTSLGRTKSSEIKSSRTKNNCRASPTIYCFL